MAQKGETLSSAERFLSLLDEEDTELKLFALEKLNESVNHHWAEISERIAYIEEMSEDDAFAKRELASLVASKVYYHLGEFSDALRHALGAGQLFDLTQTSEYLDTMISKCIDEYVRIKQENYSGNTSAEVDSRLEAIVERMFQRCYESGRHKRALGIAIESRRLDKVRECITKASDMETLLEYCFQVSLTLVDIRDFRHNIFKVLVELYQTLVSPDYLIICRILVFLDDAASTASILLKLVNGSEDECLLAYQIAFDLVTNGSQNFLMKVRRDLPAVKEVAAEDDDLPEGPTVIASENKQTSSSEVDSRNSKLHSILSGETTIDLYLQFLHSNNHADLGILKNTKTACMESRNSVTHNATIFANSTMNAGTTRDTFLRDNLEWLSKATNWARFSASAGLGVIHKGHLKEGFTVLQPYLPRDNVVSSPYSEGGALFGLGLIHANHGEKISSYLLQALRNSNNNEIIQHGACLGLGVAAMASGDDDVYNELLSILYLESSIAGSAAAIAMGLVMLGTASEKSVSEMLAYARQTEREKILHGLALGIALIMYGREEQADAQIDQMTLDKDPILRYGGMYTIGLAYCGTSNNGAIRKLLHFAVSDVNDDVRRAAVTCLGFLLSSQPKQCPEVVSLLAESYNPHVRYGSAMAVGTACSGTALPEAIDLLLPLANDPEDYVRQGALIALSMVLIQTTAEQESKVNVVRKLFDDKITDKRGSILTKFGAILAQGIIDAGGRNVTLSQRSLTGHRNMVAVVGLALFQQYWYWFPFIHYLSMAFTPTVVIGLNKDLKLPIWNFVSNARPSLFAYPPDVKPPTTSAPTKVATAVLSTTRKAKQRQATKDKDGDEVMGDVEEKPADAGKKDEEKKDEEKKDETKEESKEEEEEETSGEIKKKKEPQFEQKSNPARATISQIKYLSVSEGSRYVPIRYRNKGDLFGITILKDLQPDQAEKFVGEDEDEEMKSKEDSDKEKELQEELKKQNEQEAEAPPSFKIAF